jgi:hypothetical protein
MYAVDKAWYTKLTGSTALCALVGGTASPRIYNTMAPQNATLPFVVFQKQGGGHIADNPREYANMVYMTKAVGGKLSECEAIEVEVINAIDRQTLAIADNYAHVATFKRGHLHFIEDIGGGSMVYHIGGLYEVQVTEDIT